MSQRPEGYESLDELADASGRYQPTAGAHEFCSLAKNVRVYDEGRYCWHGDPGYRHGPIRVNSPRTDSFGGVRERNISVPTLLVRGGHSDVLSE